MVTRRVFESWIWHVFNPLIDHCSAELELLPQSLTFRVRGHGLFTRLTPMRSALMPSGQGVLDDMQGDLPEFDELVVSHDQALNELLISAVKASSLLKTDAAFIHAVHASTVTLSQQGFPVEGNIDEVVDTMAAYTVNELAADLTTQFFNWRLWNVNRSEFIKTAEPALADLRAERRRFGERVRRVREQLALIRKKLSREHDIPIALSGESREEAIG